jgi:hypothetical protein
MRPKTPGATKRYIAQATKEKNIPFLSSGRHHLGGGLYLVCRV